LIKPFNLRRVAHHEKSKTEAAQPSGPSPPKASVCFNSKYTRRLIILFALPKTLKTHDYSLALSFTVILLCSCESTQRNTVAYSRPMSGQTQYLDEGTGRVASSPSGEVVPRYQTPSSIERIPQRRSFFSSFTPRPVVAPPVLYSPPVNTFSSGNLFGRRSSSTSFIAPATSFGSYDPNSLSNPYGAGSPYKADGLMNPYSQFGSQYSNKSWTNPYANDAPKLYDSSGRYLGRFSANPYHPDSTSNPYGRYGSQYSPDSINNPYGAGNPYSTSPIFVRPQR
jgi:hypothetical protein